MKLWDFIKREIDLVLSIVLFGLILLIRFYFGVQFSSLISFDALLEVYIAIIAVVLTVFAIITVLPGKLYVNVIRKKYYTIFKRSFYTPFVASALGIIYTVLITFTLPKSINEIFYLINLGILIYSVLSSLVLFDFIFKLTFALKKEMHKK